MTPSSWLTFVRAFEIAPMAGAASGLVASGVELGRSPPTLWDPRLPVVVKGRLGLLIPARAA